LVEGTNGVMGDALLTRLGWRVVRVSDAMVQADMPAVLAAIRAALAG